MFLRLTRTRELFWLGHDMADLRRTAGSGWLLAFVFGLFFAPVMLAWKTWLVDALLRSFGFFVVPVIVGAQYGLLLTAVAKWSRAHPGPVLAGLGRRVFAFTIDSAIMVGGLALVVSVFGVEESDGPELMLLAFVGLILYSIVMEASTAQATVGKIVMGLKVVTIRHGRPSLGTVFGRVIGKTLSMFVLALPILMIPFSANRQSLYDKLAGTFVISRYMN